MRLKMQGFKGNVASDKHEIRTKFMFYKPYGKRDNTVRGNKKDFY